MSSPCFWVSFCDLFCPGSVFNFKLKAQSLPKVIFGAVAQNKRLTTNWKFAWNLNYARAEDEKLAKNLPLIDDSLNVSIAASASSRLLLCSRFII